MGVEPKIGGKPPKWMVKIMENLIKIDDLGEKKTYFWFNIHCGKLIMQWGFHFFRDFATHLDAG